jgi:hypothetical protein
LVNVLLIVAGFFFLEGSGGVWRDSGKSLL